MASCTLTTSPVQTNGNKDRRRGPLAGSHRETRRRRTESHGGVQGDPTQMTQLSACDEACDEACYSSLCTGRDPTQVVVERNGGRADQSLGGLQVHAGLEGARGVHRVHAQVHLLEPRLPGPGPAPRARAGRYGSWSHGWRPLAAQAWEQEPFQQSCTGSEVPMAIYGARSAPYGLGALVAGAQGAGSTH